MRLTHRSCDQRIRYLLREVKREQDRYIFMCEWHETQLGKDNEKIEALTNEVENLKKALAHMENVYEWSVEWSRDKEKENTLLKNLLPSRDTYLGQ